MIWFPHDDYLDFFFLQSIKFFQKFLLYGLVVF